MHFKLSHLQKWAITELCSHYENLFPKPPPSVNKQYLMKRIAYKLQEVDAGDSVERLKSGIEQDIAETNPLHIFLQKQSSPLRRKLQIKKIQDRRIPPPGTVISRTYKNQTYTISVLEHGFQFQGKKYRSLSAVALEITGAHWNGMLFFNL